MNQFSAINMEHTAALALDRTVQGDKHVVWERHGQDSYRRVGSMTMLTVSKLGDGQFEFTLETSDGKTTWGSLTSTSSVLKQLWEAVDSAVP
jgi:hypothetical protein